MKKVLLTILVIYSAVISYLYFGKKQILNIMDKRAAYIDKNISTIVNKDINKTKTNISANAKSTEKNSNTQKVTSSNKVLTNTTKKTKQDSNKQVIKIPDGAVVIELPKVPKVEAKVPQVITIGSTYKSSTREETKELSMQMPKNKIVKRVETKRVDSNGTKESKEESQVGLNHLGRVSTYLRGEFIPIKDIKNRLQKSGFKILATKNLNKDASLTVIVFTSKELKELAKNSAFVGDLRILVNSKDKTISITNPYYFNRAFLADKFNEAKSKDILNKLNSAFPKLKDSKDKLKYTLLPKYQFMFGMPYYQDMIEVAHANSTQELVNKIKSKSNVAYIEKIDNNSYLIGLNLSKEGKDFIYTIGTKNALLLPYPIMVKGTKGYILDPKYYIAISYPMLKMSQFMKISSIPDIIEKQCIDSFK